MLLEVIENVGGVIKHRRCQEWPDMGIFLDPDGDVHFKAISRSASTFGI